MINQAQENPNCLGLWAPGSGSSPVCIYPERICLLILVKGMSWKEFPHTTGDCLGQWGQGCPCLPHFTHRCCKPDPMGTSSPSWDRNDKVSDVTHWMASFNSPYDAGANYSVHWEWSGFLGCRVGYAKVFGLACTKSSPLLGSYHWVGVLVQKD